MQSVCFFKCLGSVKTENDKKNQQKSGGRWGPRLPLWPMPGKDYIWWSECSSRIVSCRDSLLQSAPSEHITFYCCLLAGNSFFSFSFGTNTPVGLICFFSAFMAFKWQLEECIHLRHKPLETHTQTRADIYRGKWLFLWAFSWNVIFIISGRMLQVFEAVSIPQTGHDLRRQSH